MLRYSTASVTGIDQKPLLSKYKRHTSGESSSVFLIRQTLSSVAFCPTTTMAITLVSVSPALHLRPTLSSVSEGSREAFDLLRKSAETEIPDEFLQYAERVVFRKNSGSGDAICFPCPLRQQEAVAALKALEGCAAAAIADIRGAKREREISVTLENVASFLMSTYITNIDGIDKGNPLAKERIPGSSYVFLLDIRKCVC